MLQFAADMHPRTEHDIVVQCPIAGARNDDRMGKALLQIERLGFTQIGNALLVSRQAAWERYAPECDDLEGVTELQAVELRNMQKPVTSRNATPFSRPR